MFNKQRKLSWLFFGSLLIVSMLLSGCANHLKKGWECYDLGDYNCAQTEWDQEEKELELAQMLSLQAKAVVDMERYYNDAKEAEEGKDRDYLYKICKKILALKKPEWTNDEWLNRAPKTLEIMEYANNTISEIDKERKIAADKKKKKALAAKKEKNRKQKIKKKFNEKLKCGKDNFVAEKYEASKACLEEAEKISKMNADVELNKTDVEYFTEATDQAIKIQEEIEAERLRKLEEERIAEEERRRKAEEAIRIAEKKWIKAEAERLKREEAQRRKEAEIKRKKDLAAKRWKAFLRKGRLFKPLVATVGHPSVGKGSLRKYKSQKWQGSAQLPKVKDKSFSRQDIYALGIVIPRYYKLNYLRNYHGSKENLLKMPQTQGRKKHYYTEGYTGYRFYTELTRTKKGSKKYEIKSMIYKIPVTN